MKTTLIYIVKFLFFVLKVFQIFFKPNKRQYRIDNFLSDTYLFNMKKYLLIFSMFFLRVAFAQPLSECPPYSVLYGNDIIFALNQKPLLASLKQDLNNSDLLGNIPSFSLFKQSTHTQSYPNGNRLLSFQLMPDSNQGIQNIFYENGNLFTAIPFENNLKSGTQKIYYQNGLLFAEIPYTSDQIDGELIVYHIDGTIKMKQSFNQGIPIGTGYMYHSNGNPQLVQSYQNGLINGTQTYYYTDGTVQSVLPYSNGIISGTARVYYPDSTLLAEIQYKNNQIISNKCYTSVGQISKLNAVGIYQLENNIYPIECPYQSENILM